MDAQTELSPETLRGYLDYLRDLGVYDLFRMGEPSTDAALLAWYEAAMQAPSVDLQPTLVKPLAGGASSGAPSFASSERTLKAAAEGRSPVLTPFEQQAARRAEKLRHEPLTSSGLRQTGAPEILITLPAGAPVADRPVASAYALGPERDDADGNGIFSGEMPPTSFTQLAPVPVERVAPADRAAALATVRAEIGDCTRCPLAYAGRHTIVFADGDPQARVMFVGEGPGADEDQSGLPFVGKAGQLLNNMINAMGLKRESVYIANIVKCRPPKNRVPEPVEANTCSQFLLRQIDIVQPEVVIALGSTAATYLLGVKQSLLSLRGKWFDVRGAKCAVTYHPAFLLRDPRQKGEAWKDLQRVIAELKLQPPGRA